jgi:molybdopterin-guanine dinucleotide biosynthesis protein A
VDVAAVILAGGTAVRMDGADKASIEHAGSTFLERALRATAVAAEVVVVGDPVPTSRPATFVREDPPLGGPVAGIAAGVAALSAPCDLVLVQAVDMPLVTPATYERLLAASEDRDGALLGGADGRPRLVLTVTAPALCRALPADPHGRSVHSLLDGLDLAVVAEQDREARGVDTWRDLAQLWDP